MTIPRALSNRITLVPIPLRSLKLPLQDVNMLHWPAKSPDLPPIDHVWDNMDDKTSVIQNQHGPFLIWLNKLDRHGTPSHKTAYGIHKSECIRVCTLPFKILRLWL
ncbi:hypothetical protein AVEN_257270-1 [Araneus ventricosus]|uniref:Uncharacterized protein n=1 Tax=Araneus ventricosus TaxID=182803 RepID=A0A4Y2HBM6_ARAVE|nr:hypothetical protein AVEN_257270-1 [Araneus ventricosus]